MVSIKICDYTDMVHNRLNSSATITLVQLLRYGKERGKKSRKQQQNLTWTASEYKVAPPLSRAVISCYFLPKFGCWLHYHRLHIKQSSFILRKYNQEEKKLLGETFFISTLTPRRRWALTRRRPSMSHRQVFFQVWLQWSCLVAVRVKETHSPLWILRLFWHLGVIFPSLLSHVCFHAAGSLLAISHTPLPSCTQLQALCLSPNPKTVICFQWRNKPPLLQEDAPLENFVSQAFFLIVATLHEAGYKQIIRHFQFSRQLPPKLAGFLRCCSWKLTKIIPLGLRLKTTTYNA